MKIGFKIAIVISFTLLPFVGKSQITNTNSFETSPLTQAEELPDVGTYQIVLKINTDKPEITPDILRQIKNNRDKNEITFIKLNSDVKIKIHPLSVIKAKDFKPFETYIYE